MIDVRSFLPPGSVEHVPCLQAEKRLMLAVLEAAVSDFQKYATASSGRGRRLFADAEAWFAWPASDEALDFESICHALDFDPAFIRDGLRRWRTARCREPGPSRAVLRFPFRRVSRTARATLRDPGGPSEARKGKRPTLNVG